MLLNKKIAQNIILSSVLSCTLFASSSDASNIPNVHIGKKIVSPEKIIQLLKPNPRRNRSSVTTKETAIERHYSPRSISLEINFDFDSSQLNQRSLRQLSPIAEAMGSSQLSGLSFEMVGHTDAAGSRKYNQYLSVKRAKTVKRFFIEQFGISSDKLQASGKGEIDLLNPKKPFSSVNRRVTIIATQI